MKQYNRIVIGIDQSYSRTGITVLGDKQIVKMLSIDYAGCKNNTMKRFELRNKLYSLMREIDTQRNTGSKNITVIVERIRLRSQGILSESYIKSTGALVAAIIDFFYYYNNIPVYSVDTRAWKSAIVGTSKPVDNDYGIDPHKYPTILYMRRKGLLGRIAVPYEGRGKKGIIPIKIEGKKVPCKINDDVADSYCIAMYGFLPKGKQNLKEEKF